MTIEEDIFISVENNYRDILLFLEIIITFLCIEFFVIFFIRYGSRANQPIAVNSTVKNELNFVLERLEGYLSLLKNRELSFVLFFFMVAMKSGLFILGDFYSGNNTARQFFLYAGYLEFILSFVFLASSLEQHELRGNKFLFTRIFGLLVFLTMILLSFYPQFAIIITYIAFPTGILLILQYGKKLYQRSTGLHRIVLPSLGLIIGLFLLTSGFLFSLEALINIFGWESRLIGDLMQVIGVFFIAASFYFIPSISELDWMTKIQSLYVIHPSGLSLFDFRFRDEEYIEADLTTSAIVSIKALYQEITSNKRMLMTSIRRENFTLILSHGTHIISVILADEDSISLHEKNQKFCQLFEEQFSQYLINWNGDVKPFRDAKAIVKEIFTEESVIKE